MEFRLRRVNQPLREVWSYMLYIYHKSKILLPNISTMFRLKEKARDIWR